MTGQVDFTYVPEGFGKRVVVKDDTQETVAALESGAYPERYGLLESALAEAVEKHVITPLPTTKPAHKNEYAVSRLKTIRKRLFMLGYLERDSGQANLGAQLETAIKTFQKEVGLTVGDFAVDGWVGEQTWAVLQELVSFEEPTNLERWFDRSGLACSALKRAVHLRLHALGLCPSSPLYGAPDNDQINHGLDTFTQLSNACFDLADQDLSGDLCLSSVSLLMDQDALVAHLAASEPLSGDFREQLNGKGDELSTIFARFILNMARSELWLLGYDHVAPSGYRDSDILSTFDRRYELRMGSLFDVIGQFWDDRNEGGHKTMYARQFLTKYFPIFFGKIHAEMLSAMHESPVDSEDVYRNILESSDEESDINLIQKVWQELRSIGSRIWDGIKRAWHWFKSIVKQGVTWLKNLTRLAYSFILKSFEAVRAVVSGVVGSLSFFAKKELVFPWRGLKLNPDHPVLRMHHDKDFDFTTVVHDFGNPEDVNRVAEYLANKSSMFALSCKFMASLLDMVIDLIRRSVFTGWAALLMALLRLYKSIKQSAPAMIAFVEQEQRMQANI